MVAVQEQVLRREAEDFKTQKEASMPCFRMSPLGRAPGIFSIFPNGSSKGPYILVFFKGI